LALAWLNDYYRESGITSPKDIPSDNMTGVVNQRFIDGKAGKVVGDYTFLSNVRRHLRFGDHVGVAPMPYFEGGTRANQMGYSGFGIVRTSEHAPEAWSFLEYLFLTSNEATSLLAPYYLTPVQSISQANGQAADPLIKPFMDELKYANGQLSYLMADQTLFTTLLTTKDDELQAKLHDIALQFDQVMKASQLEQAQQLEEYANSEGNGFWGFHQLYRNRGKAAKVHSFHELVRMAAKYVQLCIFFIDSFTNDAKSAK
jgi:ABC-type glycerol-3-phosphate transport system substrate-binding protein